MFDSIGLKRSASHNGYKLRKRKGDLDTHRTMFSGYGGPVEKLVAYVSNYGFGRKPYVQILDTIESTEVRRIARFAAPHSNVSLRRSGYHDVVLNRTNGILIEENLPQIPFSHEWELK